MDESYLKWKMPPALDLLLRNGIKRGWDETYDAAEIVGIVVVVNAGGHGARLLKHVDYI